MIPKIRVTKIRVRSLFLHSKPMPPDSTYNKCRYFYESLFWASQPNQAAKITRQLLPSAAPIRPRHLVTTQQGVVTLASSDFTAFRDALQVFYVSLRKPARHYTYRGLKIFTSLPLRFQDFQRLKLAKKVSFSSLSAQKIPIRVDLAIAQRLSLRT